VATTEDTLLYKIKQNDKVFNEIKERVNIRHFFYSLVKLQVPHLGKMVQCALTNPSFILC